MIDPRILHQVTVEITTGFLMLAGITVAAKLASDLWLRRFSGRYWTLDRWSRSIGTFAEPTSFVALTAGVISAFVTIWTGSHAWPAATLWADPTVYNKILLVGLSTTLFLGAFALRARFKSRIWRAPSAGAFYALLVLAGNGFLVLQNSVGGHLQGSGSLLDDFLAMVNLNETVMWTFPTQAAIACLVAFPLIVLGLGLSVRSSNRLFAHRELAPLAEEVRGLLADAWRADLAVDGPRRLIGLANFAAQRGHYARAVRLLEKAKGGLLIAHPFSGSVEEVELWAGIDPPPAGVRSALQPPRHEAMSDGVRRGRGILDSGSADAIPRGRTGPANLPEAVGLVEGSLQRFDQAPLLQLQQELRAARDALLDLKVRGRDLTQPIRILSAAHAHIQRGEWNEAIRSLEQFRLEMRRATEADSATARRRARSDDPASPADET